MKQTIPTVVANVVSGSVGSAGDLEVKKIPVTTTSSPPSLIRVGYPSIRMSISKKFSISSAHYLPSHEGRCAYLHGHNYVVELTMRGVVTQDPESPKHGMIEDFFVIDHDFGHFIDQYDHRCLNDFYGNPTAENLAVQWLTALHIHDSRYVKVTVWETDDCSATASIL